jgi:hypothetical protein
MPYSKKEKMKVLVHMQLDSAEKEDSIAQSLLPFEQVCNWQMLVAEMDNRWHSTSWKDVVGS